MREFKDEQITFYCNCLGELHRGGKEMLQDVKDLPEPLQRIYETIWTDNLVLPCYIAYVDNRPGLLLAAEYNEEECKRQNIPYNPEAQYATLSKRCEQLEPLVRTVNQTAELGIGIDTGFDMELMLFIPTQAVSELEVMRLYYLMDSYAFESVPDMVLWEDADQALMGLAKRCSLPSETCDKLARQLAAGKSRSIPNELSSRFDTVAGRKELIERYGDSDSMFIGNNAEGETVYLSVDTCGIILKTEQKNGWVRVTYYDADGVATGEGFDGKWKEGKTDGA